jgi:hypothetical protein
VLTVLTGVTSVTGVTGLTGPAGPDWEAQEPVRLIVIIGHGFAPGGVTVDSEDTCAKTWSSRCRGAANDPYGKGEELAEKETHI